MSDFSASMSGTSAIVLPKLGANAAGVFRVLGASLLGAAGVVHLVMVPAHIADWAAEGIGFAIVGWIQIAVALALVVKPRFAVIAAAGGACAVPLALWIVSRTSGFPIGPTPGQAETISMIDAATAVMEGLGLAALSTAVLRPGALASSGRRWMMAIPLVVMATTTWMLASPSARGHSHSSGTDHAAADGATAAHHDGATGESVAHSHEPSADAPVEVASLGPAPAVAGETHAHDGDAAHAAPSAAAADDKGLSLVMNGHQHDQDVIPMDGPTTATLAHQLARTAELVAMYPTVAEAEAGGYRRQGPYSPGLGTHYGKGGDTLVGAEITDDNVLNPMLIFDGSEPDSKLSGFMYIAFGVEGVPQGFAGENDTWHYHTNVCLVVNEDGSTDTPLGADRDNVPEELCKQYGGFLIDNTGYMLHVWTVPGYESSKGVFNEVNPALACADGTYFMKPIEELGSSLSLCADAA
jgi:hypothetical protein